MHSDDVGEAYRLAVMSDVRGAFNVASEPVLDSKTLAELLGARLVPMSAKLAPPTARSGLPRHLVPIPEGWFDLAVGVPLLDTTRAQQELGWRPRHGADEAFLELVHGIRDDAGRRRLRSRPGRAVLSGSGSS